MSRHTQYIIFITIIMSTYSCSVSKKMFMKDVESGFSTFSGTPEILTEEKTANLPYPIQQYLKNSGFIGRPIPVNAQIQWSQSSIGMKPGKKHMKLKTLQYNSTETPFRSAYMKARIGGIFTFDGRDLFANDKGHMYGKLMNIITIFDEKHYEIGQSALIIILAEALLVPGYAFQEYMKWEYVDQYCAKGIITTENYQVTGLFFFNENYELIRFESSDRYYLDPEKGNIKMPFVANMSEYIQCEGVKIPSKITAAWHLPDGIFEYWTGTIAQIRYNISHL
jgi:hypothetical protein